MARQEGPGRGAGHQGSGGGEGRRVARPQRACGTSAIDQLTRGARPVLRASSFPMQAVAAPLPSPLTPLHTTVGVITTATRRSSLSKRCQTHAAAHSSPPDRPPRHGQRAPGAAGQRGRRLPRPAARHARLASCRSRAALWGGAAGQGGPAGGREQVGRAAGCCHPCHAPAGGPRRRRLPPPPACCVRPALQCSTPCPTHLPPLRLTRTMC